MKSSRAERTGGSSGLEGGGATGSAGSGTDAPDDVEPVECSQGRGDRLDGRGQAGAEEPGGEEVDLVAERPEARTDFGGDGGDVVDFGDAHGEAGRGGRAKDRRYRAPG